MSWQTPRDGHAPLGAPASSQALAAFVSYREARADGDGGNHRTYQIRFDLEAALGPERVWTLSVDEWLADPHHDLVASARASWLLRLRRRTSRMVENPYKLLRREAWSHGVRFGTQGVLSQGFVETYAQQLQSWLRPAVCIVDHPMFDQIRAINARAGIPTLIASHNLESLDVGRLRLDRQLDAQMAGVDLANELRALARYDARLAISKVEASLLTGVGLECAFYPYVPRGEVRAGLAQVAARRVEHPPDPHLFILMGTAYHAPTRRSLDWFIRQAMTSGLPPMARVAIVGDRVAELMPPARSVPGLELHGRVSNADLAELLSRAGTALVPQRMGFGALTRIAEFACAGVPVLTFPHAAFAIDPSPGLSVLPDDSWPTLVGGMQASMGRIERVDPAAYTAWEQQAPRPLGQAVRRLLAHHAVGG